MAQQREFLPFTLGFISFWAEACAYSSDFEQFSLATSIVGEQRVASVHSCRKLQLFICDSV